MKLLKPVKRWALGFRVSSNLNKSFNWVEFANENTFDTKEEAEAYMEAHPDWNNHRNVAHAGDPTRIKKSRYCGPFELTDEEVTTYQNRQYS